MYDEENSLSEALICPNCNSPYDEPKILPCGKIVCNECIAIIICRNNKACKKFKCLCDQSHQLPPKGEFPTCGPLLKLIQKRMDSNSRLNLSQCLKENIGKLKAKMNEYTKDIYSGTDLIKKHCENERNAISLECDILCKELEKSRDAFIEKVNEYEAKRLEKLSECVNKQKCKFSIDMDSIDETETERNLFISSKYNEKFLEEANDVVKDRMEELENEHKCFLESPLFGDGKPLFKPQSKKSTNLLGSMDISFQENKIKDMNNLDLTSVLCDYKTVEFIDFIGGVNLFVSCRSKTSEYLLIDLETSSILYKFAEKDEHVKAINALFLQIKTDDWKIMVNVIDKNGCNFLKMFDLKMELLHQVKVFEYSLIGLDHGKLSSCPQEKLEQTRNVYCISRNSSSLHIKIYNWKLEYVNAIGQSENPDKKYYISSNTKQLVQLDKQYLVLSNNTFSTIDVETGDTIRSFDIQADHFLITMPFQKLFFVSYSTNKISMYSTLNKRDLSVNDTQELNMNQVSTLKVFKVRERLAYFNRGLNQLYF